VPVGEDGNALEGFGWLATENSVVKERGGLGCRKETEKATESDGVPENSQKTRAGPTSSSQSRAEEWRCISLFSGCVIREKEKYRRYYV
jgi:hypothetical protein